MNLHSLTRVASLEAAHRRKYGIHAVPEYMQTDHLYYQSTDVKAKTTNGLNVKADHLALN